MAINIKMLGTEKRSNYKNVNKVFWVSIFKCN